MWCVASTHARRRRACREMDAGKSLTARPAARKVCKLLKTWGGRWESNPQRPEPQSGALPVELLPPLFRNYSNRGFNMSELPSGAAFSELLLARLAHRILKRGG